MSTAIGSQMHEGPASAGDGARPGAPAAVIAFVNFSQETFTPTISGAIATSIWQLVQVPCVNMRRPVLTQSAAAEPYPYADLHILRPRQFAPMRGRCDRAFRRFTGWSLSQRAYARAALRCLRSLHPDAVICNNEPEIAAYFARKLPKTRVVHYFRNVMVPRHPLWRRRYWRASQRGHVVSVANSSYTARAVEWLYPLRPLSVAVIPNGVDCQQFFPRPDREAAAESAPPTVAFLGRVAVEKGPDVLLRAASSLAAKGIAFQLLIIGDTNWGFNDGGPYARTIASLIAELRTQGVHVVQAGHVPRAELPELLRGVDIQVVSSRWDEPFGLVTLEGMATGLPVIATATGGTPEVLSGTGVLVPREDEGAMAAALEQLIADREARTQLGKAARERAEEFTWAATWRALAGAALNLNDASSSKPVGFAAETL
jgi:glycosyltransferase involved in cell wall biosynthesis